MTEAPPSPRQSDAAGLEVEKARANLMQENGSVYLSVVNHGEKADRLLMIETEVARQAETHETVEENGVLRMVARPEGFVVPAHGTLELSPGGKHIMLIDLAAGVEERDSVGLTLHFESSQELHVQAEILDLMPGDHGSAEHHIHHEMDHDSREEPVTELDK